MTNWLDDQAEDDGTDRPEGESRQISLAHPSSKRIAVMVIGLVMLGGASWALDRWVSSLSLRHGDGPVLIGWEVLTALWPIGFVVIFAAVILSLVVAERIVVTANHKAVHEAQEAAKKALASEFQHANQMKLEAERIVAQMQVRESRQKQRADAAETKAKNAAGQVAGLKAQLDRRRHRNTHCRAS